MNLEQLKKDIESRTLFRFIVQKNVLGEDVLLLQGLPRHCEITLSMGRYSMSLGGKPYYSVGGVNKKERSGFGCPRDSVDEVIKTLEKRAPEHGWKKPDYLPVDMFMFGEPQRVRP